MTLRRQIQICEGGWRLISLEKIKFYDRENSIKAD